MSLKLRSLGPGDYEVEYLPQGLLRVTWGEHEGETFEDTTGMTETIGHGRYLLGTLTIGQAHATLRPMVFADRLSMVGRRRATVRVEVPGPVQHLRRVLLVGEGGAKLVGIDVPGAEGNESEQTALHGAMEQYRDGPAPGKLALSSPVAVREKAVDLLFENVDLHSVSTPRVVLEFFRDVELTS